ncbi:CML24, partial [Symbiodinium microadriaticum]
DGDGTITKQELGSILKEQADGEVIMNMVQEVDLDGDGQISFDEFVKMMEKGGSAA